MADKLALQLSVSPQQIKKSKRHRKHCEKMYNSKDQEKNKLLLLLLSVLALL